MINIIFGWIWITMGFVSGAVIGLGFHKDKFMGGYGSWERRLARLGHIAFFGTGFLNVMLGLTLISLEQGLETDQGASSLIEILFMVGAIGMPVGCFGAAFWKPMRHMFVIPVISLVLGGFLLCVELIGHLGS